MSLKSSKSKRGSAETQTHVQLRTKKQRAKERCKKLQEILKEKRALGLIKKSDKRPKSKSERAGVCFPVTKFLKKFKKLNPNNIVPTNTAIFLSAVLEYLTAELLELAGNVSINIKRKRIIPRHLFLAIKNDLELDLLLKDIVLVQGGAIPGIHPNLLTTKTPKLITKKVDETEKN